MSDAENPERDTQKPQERYMSKFRPTVVLENKSTKEAMRTMGPAKVEPPSPEIFLKKHSKEPKLPEKIQCSNEHRPIYTVRKPPVPARTDNPLMGIHTKRDFIKTATAVPMKPEPACVDSSKGHKQLLDKSGLVPKYTKKKDFGKVPEYLQQRKEDEQRAQEEYDKYVKEQREQGAMKLQSEEERQATLECLKKKWQKLYQDYQCLPLVIDIPFRKSRKERLEKELNELEKYIDRIEMHKTIYIANK